MNCNNLKIKIIGAGPTGSLLALSLIRLGCHVNLYDCLDYNQLIGRSRAYAITHSSRKLLEELRLWESIKPYMNSFQKLIVKDTVINKDILFVKSDLLKSNKKYDSIGWILDHKNLMNVLLNELNNSSLVKLNLGNCTNDLRQEYDLVFAADGKSSPSRISSGINEWKFNYKQACLTFKVLMRGSKSNIAFEILRKEGPMAILPMGNDVYQIVISDSYEKCNLFAKYEKSKLLDKLATIVPNNIQPDAILGETGVFRNSFFIASKFSEKRFFLIGESAHSFHPVGGQGLNLCLRDIQTITFLLNLFSKNRYKFSFLSYVYNLIRIVDIISIGFITDSLIRLFSNSSIFTIIPRFIINLFIKYIPFIRKIVLSIMTNGIYNIFK
tara:strand:- start:31468 stop:32616 length:1149 start_codon:yes stop_codon:yes gene_type:complete